MNTNGVDTQNQRASNAKNVVNGMAAELPFAQRTIFKMKKVPKIKLKNISYFLKINYRDHTQDIQWLSTEHFSSIDHHQTL
jgi:hypothetical protein